MLQLRGRRIRPRRVVAVLAILWLAWSGFEIFRAATSALDGRRAADRVRTETSVDDLVAGRPVADLRRADAAFGRARAAAEDPLLAPFRVLPFVGRQLRAVGALSADARIVAEVGLRGLSDGRALLGSHPTGGPARVATLLRLSTIAARAYRNLAQVGPIPDHLVGPLARARAKFDDDLVRLRTALVHGRDGAAAAAGLLEGPHHYLLLAANNGEMRAGSGMFLSAAEMSTAQGRISIGPVMATGLLTLPAGAVPLGGDLQARWGWAGPSQDWRNLALSPRFDANAALAARMWHAATGGTVDGVMAVDAVFLQDMLAAVGPVTVEGRSVSSGEVLPYVLHDQYAGVTFTSSQGTRRDELGALASAALQAAQSRPVHTSALAGQLASASAGRHLLLWSADPKTEAAWRALDTGGLMGPDDVMVAVLNQGGNKLDQYLQVAVKTTVRARGADRQVGLEATLHDVAPVAGQSPYVVGPYPDSSAPAGQYTGIVSFSLPAGAARIRVTGGGTLAAAGPDGAGQVWATTVSVAPGGTVQVGVQFEVAGAHSALTVQPSARVPAESWVAPGAAFDDGAAHVLRW